MGFVSNIYRAAALVLLSIQPVMAQAAPSVTTAPPAAAAAPTPEATAPATPSEMTRNAATSVAPPAGMCPLDPGQDADRAAISEMHISAQGEYKLLGVFAECRQLTALRAGSQQVRFLSQYSTVIEQQNAPVTFNRGSTVLALSSAIGLTSAFASEPTQATKSESTTMGVRNASYHGVIKQTADFIIVGSEQRHIMRKQEYAVAAVSLITVAKGAVVTVNFFAPVTDAGTYTALGTQAEAYFNQTLAANP